MEPKNAPTPQPREKTNGFWSRRIASFQDAARGVAKLVRTETHAKIHLTVAALVAIAGFLSRLEPAEWCFVLFAMAIVWVAEGFNTSVERLADAVHPDKSPLIGEAKDIAAGAVLIAAVAAIFIGLIVFGPRLLQVLN